jgi:TolB-like protein
MAVIPMPDPRSRPGLEPGLEPERSASPEVEADASRARKKKDKVRAAWISFVGRIVAQVVGAMVTVALTLFVVQKAQQAPQRSTSSLPPGESQPSPATTPTSLAGESGAASRPTPTTPSVAALPAIAVLPLDNFSGDPGQDGFADGMTEALIAELAQIDRVRVISRTSSMRYRGSRKSLPEIARELGATHIVEGSVSRDRAGVRVTAQLIDAASDRHLWAASYDRRVADLAVQGEVAESIAREIAQATHQSPNAQIPNAPIPIAPIPPNAPIAIAPMPQSSIAK